MTTLITDDQELVSATTRHGSPIKTYDDGMGALYTYRDAGGLVGLVRALTWEDAWEIVEDEILKPIPEEEIHMAYGYFTVCSDPFAPDALTRQKFYARHDSEPRANLAAFESAKEARAFCMSQIEATGADLVEGYTYQSNATGSGIVAHDLNGERLDVLTPDLLAELEWRIGVRDLD